MLALPKSHAENLVYNSKMSAKVDSALVQDGFQLYHHSFFFSLGRDENNNRTIKNWAVVQQGMNAEQASARRYHWFSEDARDLIAEPHSGISSAVTVDRALDLTAKKSEGTRELSTELVQAGYAPLMKDIQILRKHSSHLSQVLKLSYSDGRQRVQGSLFDDDRTTLTLLNLETNEFKDHPVVREDFSKSKYLEKVLAAVTDAKPKTYEQLVAMPGVGAQDRSRARACGRGDLWRGALLRRPGTIQLRAWRKRCDALSRDRKTFDETIAMLSSAVQKTKLPHEEKRKAVSRLYGGHYST